MADFGLLSLCGKLVIKASNITVDVVILMWMFYEYSAYSVELQRLQTAAAVTGINLYVLYGETLDRTHRLTVSVINLYNIILMSYEKNIIDALLIL